MCLSICPFVCLRLHPLSPVRSSFFHFSVKPPVRPSVRASARSFIRLSIRSSDRPPFVSTSVCQSVYLFDCPLLLRSIYLSLPAPFLFLSVFPTLLPFMCPSERPSVCTSVASCFVFTCVLLSYLPFTVRPSVTPPIRSSIRPSHLFIHISIIRSSVHSFVFLSIQPSVHLFLSLLNRSATPSLGHLSVLSSRS